jgi:hypothetical protein
MLETAHTGTLSAHRLRHKSRTIDSWAGVPSLRNVKLAGPGNRVRLMNHWAVLAVLRRGGLGGSALGVETRAGVGRCDLLRTVLERPPALLVD